MLQKIQIFQGILHSIAVKVKFIYVTGNSTSSGNLTFHCGKSQVLFMHATQLFWVNIITRLLWYHIILILDSTVWDTKYRFGNHNILQKKWIKLYLAPYYNVLKSCMHFYFAIETFTLHWKLLLCTELIWLASHTYKLHWTLLLFPQTLFDWKKHA